MTNAKANSSPATFDIRLGMTGTPKADWRVMQTCATGAEAAELVAVCKERGFIIDLSTMEQVIMSPGSALAVVRVAGAVADPTAPIVDWRARELERFASGHYKPVPWFDNSDSSVETYYGWQDHFAHIAKSDSRKIAFTESEAKGLDDVQKVLGVDEYLKRFWSGTCPDISKQVSGASNPEMTPASRSAFSDLVSGVSLDLRVTSTADEMIGIYKRVGYNSSNAGSCMGYDNGHFDTRGVHPVRVYAEGGDLALAYIENDTGNILGRTLVWPAKLTYGRIYAVSGKGSLLSKALRIAGYTECRDWLAGAKLAVIPIRGRDNQYVMPYIDSNDSHTFGGDPDVGFYIGGEFNASNQNGVGTIGPQAACWSCDVTYPEDNMRSHDDELYCNECYSDSFMTCGECNESVSQSSCESIQVYGNRYETQACNSCRDDMACLSDGRYAPYGDTLSCEDCDDTIRCDDALSSATDDCQRCEDCHDTHLDTVAIETGVARPVLYVEAHTVLTMRQMFTREGVLFSDCNERPCTACDSENRSSSEAIANRAASRLEVTSPPVPWVRSDTIVDTPSPEVVGWNTSTTFSLADLEAAA
ncbi:hypothetical protein [Sphingomonas paeninsulae]|nr:hypothetical protein [Sphingomonas paeninsulae]